MIRWSTKNNDKENVEFVGLSDYGNYAFRVTKRGAKSKRPWQVQVFYFDMDLSILRRVHPPSVYYGFEYTAEAYSAAEGIETGFELMAEGPGREIELEQELEQEIDLEQELGL